MKTNFLGIILLTSMFIFVSCQRDNLKTSKEDNPCRRLAVNITSGSNFQVGVLTPIYDGLGSDTVWVNYFGNSLHENRYSVFSYDDDGLPLSSHTYLTSDNTLLDQIEMEWFDEGKLYLRKFFEPNGELIQQFEYDINENVKERIAYTNGGISLHEEYRNLYNSNDQILSITRYDLLKNDTMQTDSYLYDQDDNLLSITYDRRFFPQAKWKDSFSYDSEGRIIEVVSWDELSNSMTRKVTTEYLNEELEKRINHFDSNNELLRYLIMKNDEHGNQLMSSTYLGINDDLMHTIEYTFRCE